MHHGSDSFSTKFSLHFFKVLNANKYWGCWEGISVHVASVAVCSALFVLEAQSDAWTRMAALP